MIDVVPWIENRWGDDMISRAEHSRRVWMESNGHDPEDRTKDKELLPEGYTFEMLDEKNALARTPNAGYRGPWEVVLDMVWLNYDQNTNGVMPK